MMKSIAAITGKLTLAMVMAFSLSSCSEDEMMEEEPAQSMTFDYAFSSGYSGSHPTTLDAMMEVEEIDNNSSRITVTLTNTLDGEMYMIHAHDAADANNTPNGTPYNETPNSGVFVQMVNGNGGTVEVSQVANMSYEDITGMYEGFFVVHDPTQAISTTDISTYLVVGAFAR